jgi:hypothetical protein
MEQGLTDPLVASVDGTDEGEDEAELDPEEGVLTEVGPLDAEVLAFAARLPIVLRDVHIEDGGAGCAEGVDGSPWKNVEVPYTPMGSPVSPRQSSNTSAS